MTVRKNGTMPPTGTTGAAASAGTPAADTFAYAYQIVPPQTKKWQHEVQGLLDAEHAQAQQEGRVWSARLMFEPQVTRILVVSDHAEPDHLVNRKLETALRDLQVEVTRTDPVSMRPDDGTAPA